MLTNDDFDVSLDTKTDVWIVRQSIEGYGKQVVGLAETRIEANKMVEDLLDGLIIPMYFIASEFELHRRDAEAREIDAAT